MEHDFFSDGNSKQISWALKTENSIVEQKREHVDIYLDNITDEQSKYIAFHVGIFWCIGTFLIKNKDAVNAMIDSKSMFNHLSKNTQRSDPFIEKRAGFIRQLILQRKLHINFKLIDNSENLASKLLQGRIGT